ncbi:type VI secretion system tube protein TssD [Cellulophaga sp. Ld12]|uniref:type VI secretion system tube protein TssD n=1 Tax=Cellulophaga sp. Ld12 TaxID=3229535 RepID=UPI00386B4BFB
MAFLAKLFINGEQRNVLNGNYVYHQLLDARGKPKAKVEGGQLNFVVESTGDDALFHLWMLDDYQMYDGYIRFFKRDGLSKLFDFEFANCYCVGLREQFSATGHDPLKMELTITPGIQRVRDVIFEKVWNPSNPFAEAPVVSMSENEPEILGYHIEDLEGNVVERNEIEVDEEIVLVVESRNAVGKFFEINLDDQTLDYEHNGTKLKEDMFEVSITSDIERVPLKAILQED